MFPSPYQLYVVILWEKVQSNMQTCYMHATYRKGQELLHNMSYHAIFGN